MYARTINANVNQDIEDPIVSKRLAPTTAMNPTDIAMVLTASAIVKADLVA